MAVEFKLPELGEGIESGDILTVLVAEGDHVDAQQSVVEIETEKAVVEVPCAMAGTVSKVMIAEGQTVNVGDVLLTLEASDAAAATPTPEPAAAPAAAPAAEPAPPATPAPPPEPVATQVAVEPTPPPQAAPTPAPQPAAATAIAEPPESTTGEAPAGPAVRRLARELGVDLTKVAGTGAGGRILAEDVQLAVRTGGNNVAPAVAPSPPAPPPRSKPAAAPAQAPTGESDAWGPVRRERMAKIRKTIAERMVHSKHTCPHVTNFDDADVTDLEQVRQSSKADYAASGIKLTTMPFLIKAVAQALKLHPTINASLDTDAGEIIYKQYVNVGIAVDTDRGLVVPVIRDADRLAIPDIARSLSDMAESVRAGDFAMDDLRGGTFTISNLGAIGGTYSTPIINHPEVAILLVGRSRKMPVVVDDEVQIRLMMPLSLSYDHRLVDGAAAARYLNEVKDLLQNPSRLLLIP
ncbi:MAG: 2-oxo acid dehydrogenase subunit E2 [Pirellulales bacterium]|nr:2-oxo acid dehydrogenase subunit E2 [Pirellulales bacterium]